MKEHHFKRNFNLYRKEKNVIIAFGFFVLFLITFILSFISPLYDIKGIRVDFKNSKIDYVTTNNYSVTYASSGNRLFYSQSKSQKSTLNDLENIQSYDTAYGSSNPNPYNFITINYDFDSNIIKVCGIPDNMEGLDGKTYVLTESKHLYVITDKIKMIDGIFDDIFVTNYNLFVIQNNQLLKYENDVFNLYQNLDGKLQIFIISNNLEFYNYEDKSLYYDKNTNEYKNLDKQDKIVATNTGKVYGLKENKVIDLLNNDLIIDNVDDIYTCGEDALIINKGDDVYYLGELKHHVISTTPTLLDTDGIILGNRNSLIIYKNDKFYLYDKENNTYEPMYRRLFLKRIMFGFSLFVDIMILLYFVLSFKESSARYNRYFSKQLKRIDEEN